MGVLINSAVNWNRASFCLVSSVLTALCHYRPPPGLSPWESLILTLQFSIHSLEWSDYTAVPDPPQLSALLQLPLLPNKLHIPLGPDRHQSPSPSLSHSFWLLSSHLLIWILGLRTCRPLSLECSFFSAIDLPGLNRNSLLSTKLSLDFLDEALCPLTKHSDLAM